MHWKKTIPLLFLLFAALTLALAQPGSPASSRAELDEPAEPMASLARWMSEKDSGTSAGPTVTGAGGGFLDLADLDGQAVSERRAGGRAYEQTVQGKCRCTDPVDGSRFTAPLTRIVIPGEIHDDKGRRGTVIPRMVRAACGPICGSIRFTLGERGRLESRRLTLHPDHPSMEIAREPNRVTWAPHALETPPSGHYRIFFGVYATPER